MQYCPISLLFSLPTVASDSTLTVWSNWATIVGTVFGLPLTIYAIYYAKNAFKKQNEALELQKEDSDEQRILGAWSLLAQKGTGDLGRKDALEFLHKQGKSLVGLDLSNAHLVGLKLNGADLTGCNFTGANLFLAHFEGADLSHAHFEGADLRGVVCTGADLIGTHFQNTDMYKAYFENTDLYESHFEGVELHFVHFEGADLTLAHFKGAAFIEEAIFNKCHVWLTYETKTDNLPTAPEGYEFIFETNEDGIIRTKIVHEGTPHETEGYYIKLIKTETKNP